MKEQEPKIEIVGKEDLRIVGNCLYKELKRSEVSKEKDFVLIELIHRISQKLNLVKDAENEEMQ